MKSLKELIEEFADMGPRSALKRKDGFCFEGSILATYESHFEFGVGGPMAPEEPVLIQYETVDFDSLGYWDKIQGCYMDASWDIENQKWSIKKHYSN